MATLEIYTDVAITNHHTRKVTSSTRTVLTSDLSYNLEDSTLSLAPGETKTITKLATTKLWSLYTTKGSVSAILTTPTAVLTIDDLKLFTATMNASQVVITNTSTTEYASVRAIVGF